MAAILIFRCTEEGGRGGGGGGGAVGDYTCSSRGRGARNASSQTAPAP